MESLSAKRRKTVYLRCYLTATLLIRYLDLQALIHNEKIDLLLSVGLY